MDPLNALRGDIEGGRLDPLERGRLHGQAEDAAWERQQEHLAAEAASRFEGLMARAEATDRAEVYAFGHSRRELDAWKQRTETARAERIGELVDELERLQPGRAAVRRSAGEAPVPRQDPDRRDFMLRMVAEQRERKDAIRRQALAAELAGLEQAARGEISR